MNEGFNDWIAAVWRCRSAPRHRTVRIYLRLLFLHGQGYSLFQNCYQPNEAAYKTSPDGCYGSGDLKPQFSVAFGIAVVSSRIWTLLSNIGHTSACAHRVWRGGRRVLFCRTFLGTHIPAFQSSCASLRVSGRDSILSDNNEAFLSSLRSQTPLDVPCGANAAVLVSDISVSRL